MAEGEHEQQSKKIVIWSADAKAELRAIDREAAIRILHAIDHYLTTGAGDVIRLQPPRFEYRLCAKYCRCKPRMPKNAW